MTEAVLHDNPHLLKNILDHYNVGRITGIKPASHGIENLNYFVDCQDDERPRHFVLTLVAQPSFAGSSYLPMMAHLADEGLPVPAPIKNNQGQTGTIHEGQMCLLQPKLTGLHTVNPTSGQIQAVGRFLGQLHTVGSEALDLPDYPRDLTWLRSQAERVQATLPFRDQGLLTDALAQITSLLGREDVAELPKGLIHADLFRDNVLFNERGLSGVLDFHHASLGPLIYDLAVAANDWCNEAAGLLDLDRTATLLRAYNEVRPLQDQEVWFFTNFASYAALVFWLSRAVANLQAPSRKKDPDEFKRILEQHNKHGLYLDTRILHM